MDTDLKKIGKTYRRDRLQREVREGKFEARMIRDFGTRFEEKGEWKPTRWVLSQPPFEAHKKWADFYDYAWFWPKAFQKKKGRAFRITEEDDSVRLFLVLPTYYGEQVVEFRETC